MFLKVGDRHFRFFDGTVLGMRFLALLLPAVAVIAIGSLTRPARAADFYVETVSAIDGGSSPTTTASNAPKYQGNEVAIECNYEARLKICETGTTTTGCPASATHGQHLLPGKPYPVCFPAGWGKAAISPLDGGVSLSCDFSQVLPKQTCPL